MLRSWKSLAAVRKRHIVTSRFAENAGHGHISQKDMALTQFGFMGFILIRPHVLGVQVNRDDFEAFVHFWRVIGHMIGIHERFNLCTDSWRTTAARLEVILQQVYRPALQDAPPDFAHMASALIEGLWCFNPFSFTDPMLYFTRMMSDCDGYVYLGSNPRRLLDDGGNREADAKVEQMHWWYRLILWFQITVHTFLLNFAVIRWYMNQQIYISSFIIKWFPFLAIWQFGVRKAYVRILRGDVTPKSEKKM